MDIEREDNKEGSQLCICFFFVIFSKFPYLDIIEITSMDEDSGEDDVSKEQAYALQSVPGHSFAHSAVMLSFTA